MIYSQLLFTKEVILPKDIISAIAKTIRVSGGISMIVIFTEWINQLFLK